MTSGGGTPQDRHARIGDLFHQAIERSPHERLAFLQQATAGDDSLLREVLSLLSARERAGDFIASPALEVAAAALAASVPHSSTPDGSRIGPYTVVSFIGRGGMGEVYRAHDSRLKRDVAIKVLPERLAIDPERLDRFEREARVLAGLNHPHIAALYGIEDHQGRPALVMELVNGPTLADRLGKGPIPPREALGLARQIASALEGAHAQGCLHRDLKPANVLVRADGTVKLVDFGLAKMVAPPGDDESAVTGSDVSRPGSTIGTPAYMSPEQARGGTVDSRTDIWAFGCVLFEMLTGTRAFQGDTASDVIASVLEREPDFAALPAQTPPAIRRLLRRCLRKDARARLRHAGDIVIELDDVVAGDSGDDAAPRAVRRSQWLPWAVAATAAVAVVTSAGWWTSSRTSGVAPIASRYPLAFPVSAPFSPAGARGRSVALSRDGRYIATSTTRDAWTLRRRDSLEGKRIGADGVSIGGLVFSPDSAWLAYAEGTSRNGLAQITLKRMRLGGGDAVPIADVSERLLFGSAWLTNDALVFASPKGLFRVAASGGEPELLLAADESKNQRFAWPEMLPGNRWLTFTASTTATLVPGSFAGGSIEALDLQTGQRRQVLPGATRARYLPSGHLAYTQYGTLYVVPFDATSLQARGDAVSVLTDVREGDFDLAGDGTLAYVSGTDDYRTLVWVDRDGKEEVLPVPPQAYYYPSLSPDGSRVALDMAVDGRDVFTLDLRTHAFSKLTYDPAENMGPIWSPDGSRIVYGRRPGSETLFAQPADGNGPAQLLNTGPVFQFPAFFTPDGTRLVYNDNAVDISMVWLDGSRRVERLLASGAREIGGTISPDGRWMAYASDESGRFEIYLTSFPPARGMKVRVSSDGGVQPLWSPAGGEVFFRDAAGAVLAAGVTTTPTLQAGAVVRLFGDVSYAGGGLTVSGRSYDVSRDGRRFLMIKLPVLPNQLPPRSLVLVDQWLDEVARLSPTK